MSTQENVQIVKNFLAALGHRDKQGLLALSAEDIEKNLICLSLTAIYKQKSCSYPTENQPDPALRLHRDSSLQTRRIPITKNEERVGSKIVRCSRPSRVK
jgi:hypothetical protein